MGNSSYDRDVFSSTSSSGWGASTKSAARMARTSLDSSMNPAKKGLKSDAKNPIMIMLDVTGSNINLARLFYDKAPMFYGQIEQQGYLKDFELVICAVGDAFSDEYPLQIGTFAKGKAIDSWLEKLVLEGGGGGQMCESYELAACYLLNKTEFRPDAQPIVLFVGDEAAYDCVRAHQASEIGVDYSGSTTELFIDLRKKFNENVFMFLNGYSGGSFDADITDSWVRLLAPEHVIKIHEGKSVVDLMLGIIAMASKTRNLSSYITDMTNRGQKKTRIESVKKSLKNLEKALVPITITGSLTTQRAPRKSVSKSKRL